MKRLADRVALVTGGGLGIGRSACILMASEGAAVAVTVTLDGPGEEVASQSRSSGGQAAYYHLDVSDESQVAEVFTRVHGDFGRLDVLVNKAGIVGVYKPTHEVAEEDWDRLFAVNVKGVFFGTKHAIPTCAKPEAAASSTSRPSTASSASATSRHTTPPKARCA